MEKKKNRYGTEYWFEPVSEDQVKICGDLDHWRFIGTAEGLKPEALGAVDPEGGPFIALGSTIDGKTVSHIDGSGDDIIFTLKSE